jgi:hypothetical protein
VVDWINNFGVWVSRGRLAFFHFSSY